MADFGKLNFAVAFNPQTAFPLDARYYFDTLEAATTAAQSAVEVGSSDGTYFIGENLVVVTSTDATLYVIQPDKTLKAVGTSVLGDGKSITISDGTVSIKGFADATVNQQPRKNASGEIEWYTPDTSTVAGLADTVGQHTQQISTLTSDVSTLQTTVAEKANSTDVYTKTETDNKIKAAVSSVYKPSGSVAFAALPELSSTNVGNVYNITDAFTTTDNFVEGAGKKYSAGENVVIIEVSEGVYKYDVLSGMVDLTDYSTTEQIQTLLNGKVDKVEGSRLITDAEGTKLSGIEEGAQVNVINSINESEFSLDESKTLSVLSIPQSKVSNLITDLGNKVDKVAGKGLSSNDFTDSLLQKLNGITAGAQVNIIDAIKINGTSLEVTEKVVNIPGANVDTLGVVRGSTADNGITINDDFSMAVNNITTDKLVQGSATIVWNGGDATV